MPLAPPIEPAVAPLPLAVPLIDPKPVVAPLVAAAPLAPAFDAPLGTAPESPTPPVLVPPVAAPLAPLSELPELPELPEVLDAPGPGEQPATVKMATERSLIEPDIRRPVCLRSIAAPPRAIVPLLEAEEHSVSV
jgi:hypothetical protein